MEVTRYMPGEHPVGLSGFVNIFPCEPAAGVFELDADREQVAQQLGGRADQIWADSHAVVFGLANVGTQPINPAATDAVNYLLKVRDQHFTYELKGPILVVQRPDPAREVVRLVVDNDHLEAFTSFLYHYHDQRDEALAEAADEHYQQWLETREPGDQYVVSENDHSLDEEPDYFEVIHVEPGMFSSFYHLIFPSAYNAMHFGMKWSQQREQLATPGALANLTQEEQQALLAARMQPNSLQALVELRKLATPGFWQPGERSVMASITYHEDGEDKQTPAKSVLFTAQNQHYICRMHNVLPRLEARLWASLGEQEGGLSA